MNTAISIHEMKTDRANRKHAFTLIELLVVIAIIATIAGLVVGLANVAGRGKKEKRTRVELAKLVTLIEAYKTKVGIYPPDNPIKPDHNSLLYELAGAIRDRTNTVDNPTYITPFGKIRSNEVFTTYGGDYAFPPPERRAGLLNAIEGEADRTDPDAPKLHRVLTVLKPDQYATVAGHLSLVVPVDGLNGKPNPWNYLRGTNAIHNPDSFDLWVEIVIGTTNVPGGGSAPETKVIGNWKN